MTIESSIRVPLPSREGDQSRRLSDSSSLNGLTGDKVAQFSQSKPSRARKGIRMTQILSLAVLLNLATDASRWPMRSVEQDTAFVCQVGTRNQEIMARGEGKAGRALPVGAFVLRPSRLYSWGRASTAARNQPLILRTYSSVGAQ